MKATYKNSFCMDSDCINYFEDSCMLALVEKGTEIEPDHIPGHLRKSEECKEFERGTFSGYLFNEEEIK